jgi:hypothetical protein
MTRVSVGPRHFRRHTTQFSRIEPGLLPDAKTLAPWPALPRKRVRCLKRPGATEASHRSFQGAATLGRSPHVVKSFFCRRVFFLDALASPFCADRGSVARGASLVAPATPAARYLSKAVAGGDRVAFLATPRRRRANCTNSPRAVKRFVSRRVFFETFRVGAVTQQTQQHSEFFVNRSVCQAPAFDRAMGT